jgi:hypothetical protein
MINLWVSVPEETVEAVKLERVSLESSIQFGLDIDSRLAPIEWDKKDNALSADTKEAYLRDTQQMELRKVPVIEQRRRKLLDLYFTDAEFPEKLASIQKDPDAQVIGAWYWDGKPVDGIRFQRELAKEFMPPRVEVDERGEVVTVDDQELRQIVLVYGQKPRQF